MFEQSKPWTLEDNKCYKKCDYIEKETQRVIVIGDGLWLVIRAMLHKYPHDEWQMLLSGITTDAGCFCEGYYVTKQEVGSATVRHKDEITTEIIEANRFVAGIHSHVNMAVNASQIDIDDSIMSPIQYHIIVNNRLELSGYRKATLPCGGLIPARCRVAIQGDIALDGVEIVGLERIEKVSDKYEYGYKGNLYTPPQEQKTWPLKQFTEHKSKKERRAERAREAMELYEQGYLGFNG
jgi:hypothetical protein